MPLLPDPWGRSKHQWSSRIPDAATPRHTQSRTVISWVGPAISTTTSDLNPTLPIPKAHILQAKEFMISPTDARLLREVKRRDLARTLDTVPFAGESTARGRATAGAHPAWHGHGCHSNHPRTPVSSENSLDRNFFCLNFLTHLKKNSWGWVSHACLCVAAHKVRLRQVGGVGSPSGLRYMPFLDSDTFWVTDFFAPREGYRWGGGFKMCHV